MKQGLNTLVSFIYVLCLFANHLNTVSETVPLNKKREVIMAIPTIRYPLDVTGLNVNNKITGEIHELSANATRAVAPIYGAYFAQSLVVIDDLTQNILSRDTDYKCVELLQEASAAYGKEICYLIIITNKNVSPKVRINYQVLGGLYTRSTDAVGKIYELFKNQEGIINWFDILNKPYEYNPTKHLHDLKDVYGFQYLIDSLERIRSAIVLGNEPAFESFAQWVIDSIVNIPQPDWEEPNLKNDPNLKSFIRNKPPNLVAIGKITTGFGIPTRNPNGTWHLIESPEFVYDSTIETIKIRRVDATGIGIVDNTPLQELGGVDKLINGVRIGRGGGNIASNTVLGTGLAANTTGSKLTAIGNGSLALNTVGIGNVGVGSGAGGNITTGGNNIVIGTDSTASSATVSNEITLGNTTNNSFRVPGVGFSVTTGGVVTGTRFTGSTDTLTTPRLIGGVSFNGSSNIDLPGVNIEGNQNTTGSAATLTTPRFISMTGDVSWVTTFNGSTNVTGEGTLANSGVTAGTYGSVTTIPVITVDAKGRVTDATSNSITLGNGILTLAVTGTGLSGSATFAANQSTPTTFTVTSNATSVNTADAIVARDASGSFVAGTITAALAGNATTATTLKTVRTIWGQDFDGSANVTGALTGVTTIGMSGQLTSNIAIGTAPFIITSTTRVANLNVATAGTADVLTTARDIGGVSFDGSTNIDLPGVNKEGNQNTTGSAAKWTTPRTLTLTGQINGTATIDGSANVELDATISAVSTVIPPFSLTSSTPNGFILNTPPSGKWNQGAGRMTFTTNIQFNGYFAANPDGHAAIALRQDPALVSTSVRGNGMVFGNLIGAPEGTKINPGAQIELWANTVNPQQNRLVPGAESPEVLADGPIYKLIIESSVANDGNRYARFALYKPTSRGHDCMVDTGDVLDTLVGSDFTKTGLLIGHVFGSGSSSWSISFTESKVTWSAFSGKNTDTSFIEPATGPSAPFVLKAGDKMSGSLDLIGDALRIGIQSYTGLDYLKTFRFQNTIANQGTGVLTIPNGTSTDSNFSSGNVSNLLAPGGYVSHGMRGNDAVARTFGLNGAGIPAYKIQMGDTTILTVLGGGIQVNGVVLVNNAVTSIGTPTNILYGPFSLGGGAAVQLGQASLNLETMSSIGTIKSYLQSTGFTANEAEGVETITRPLYAFMSCLLADLKARKII